MSAVYVTERASPGMPSLSSHAVARSPSASRIEPTSAGSASPSTRMWVWANSSRKSATRSPIAQRRPGAGGTRTGNDPMISATAFAWSGPAPP